MTPEERLRAGAAALGRGDGDAARVLLDPLATRGASAQVWMMLGEAGRLIGDDTLLDRAADQVLAAERRAVRAYGWKGDARLRADDARGAAGWYRAGLAVAAELSPMPDALRGEVDRQRDALAALDRRFATDQRDGLARRGVSAAVSRRFAESLDLLNGHASVQLQQPQVYYFPGLPQQAFFERDGFDWVGAVEAATPAIQAELTTALRDGAALQPYIERQGGLQRDSHGMAGNADWSSLHLIENGTATALAGQAFPHTLAALAAAPLCRIGVRAPTVMVSLLKAGAHIPPHHGMINTRLICHLPLVVPGPGYLRVGNERREWTVGQLLLFDDTIEHEAKNESTADRIVLIFDVWRPELSEAERDAVVALFATIDEDGHGG